jgi:hypothetical protein
LLLITTRQTELFDGAGGGDPGPELLPVPIVLGAMATAVIARLLAPSSLAHNACLAIVVCGVATLAASLGVPFANATADYCGDFCRTAIMGRFGAFFGWPAVTALALWLVSRSEGARESPGSAVWPGWTRAWILPTLILGLMAAVLWWWIVLG